MVRFSNVRDGGARLLLGLIIIAGAVTLLARKDAPAVDATTPIACRISARSAGDDVIVTLTLANRSTSPIGILKWNLPRDGRLTAPLFAVQRDGVDLPFGGPLVKRTVTADSYESIAPGASARVDIGLRQAYDVRAPGAYTVVYRASNQRLGSPEIVTLASDPVTITITR